MRSEAILAALRDFGSKLAATSGPEMPWRALQNLAAEILGFRLFTITAVDAEAAVARRLYTNMPDAYPVAGTKPIQESPWSQHVIVERQTFVMNTNEEIASHFFDHELIRSLGCGSCVNMPVVLAGTVIGTLNLLDAEHHFTPEKLALLNHLQLPALTAFAVWNSTQAGKGRSPGDSHAQN